MPTIKLYSGEMVTVDDADFDRLSRYRWHLTGKGYAARCPKPGTTVFMHHEVIGRPKPGLQTDHINGDKLDNRRENLRHCTPSENCINRYHDRPFRGTSRKNSGWQATFCGRYLGMYKTREEAAMAARAARAFADE